MHNRSIYGLLLGCVLGLVLWVFVGLAVLSEIGYLPHMQINLWWLLGVLVTFAVIEVMRTVLRGDSATPHPPGTPSPS